MVVGVSFCRAAPDSGNCWWFCTLGISVRLCSIKMESVWWLYDLLAFPLYKKNDSWCLTTLGLFALLAPDPLFLKFFLMTISKWCCFVAFIRSICLFFSILVLAFAILKPADFYSGRLPLFLMTSTASPWTASPQSNTSPCACLYCIASVNMWFNFDIMIFNWFQYCLEVDFKMLRNKL